MTNWWQEKPIRLVQTNLPQLYAQRDPRAIVRQVHEFGGNTILLNIGGIVSFYPTELEYQTPVPGLKSDFVGEAVDEAKRLGVRFIGRVDLSKCYRHVYVAHPEWFYRRADGQHVSYNGLYDICINGGYYREYSKSIIREILERYDVDGLFFNMFSYRTTGYSNGYSGLCHCPACEQGFMESYGHTLPPKEDLSDPAYRDFLTYQWEVNDESARVVYEHVHEMRDNVAVVHGSPPIMRTRSLQYTDMVRSESGFSWQYGASDNVKRIKGSYPGITVSNAANYFPTTAYRCAAMSPHQIALRMAQDLANGAGADLYVLGTLDQDDRSALQPASDFFRFVEGNEETYTRLSSVAKIALVMPMQSYLYGIRGDGIFRGMEDCYRGMFNLLRGAFRLLTENHLTFDAIYDHSFENEAGERLAAKYDLLVLPGVAALSAEQRRIIDGYVESGGRVLAIGETARYDEKGIPLSRCGLASLGIEDVTHVQSDMRSAYLRVHDGEDLGALVGTDLIPLDRDYLISQVKPEATTLWTIVPPAMFGPPEMCFLDRIESELPGAIRCVHGQGRTTYVPWDMDVLYATSGVPSLEKAFLGLVLDLLGGQRQVVTNAHPAVEVHLLRHPSGDHVLTLVNSSGYQPPTVREPVPMTDIEIAVKLPQPVSEARAIVADVELDAQVQDGRTCVTLPRLDLFETIVFASTK